MEKETVDRKELDEIGDKFDVLASLLHKVRVTRDDVDGRSMSVCITNLETAQLWFENAIKDEGVEGI